MRHYFARAVGRLTGVLYVKSTSDDSCHSCCLVSHGRPSDRVASSKKEAMVNSEGDAQERHAVGRGDIKDSTSWAKQQ